jgi:hypothetical protein
MLHKTIALIFCCCLLSVAVAGADIDPQTAGSARENDGEWVEISLLLGLLMSDSLDRVEPGAEVEFDEDLGIGLVLGMPIAPDFRLEIIYGHNEMELTADAPGEALLARLEQQYFHVGGLWELSGGPEGGFATASIGIVQLDPGGPGHYSSETLPSFSLGGGGKFFFSDRAGLRVEGRLLGHVGAGSMFCSSAAGCLGRASGSLLLQFQANAGVTVRF